MTVYYVESSAWLKRYKSEKGSEVVAELFEGKALGELFVTSHLSILEVSSVAARLSKGKVLKPTEYEVIVGTFVHDLATYGVVVTPLHDGVIDEAMGLLPKYPLRTADALQLGAALSARHEADDEPFYVVSADKEIGEACAGYRMSVLDPELPSALEQLRALRLVG